MDVRKVIEKRLKQMGKTKYWLAKSAGMRLPTVYDYMKGRNDMTGTGIGKLLDVLEMTIVAATHVGVPDSKPAASAGRKRKRT